MSEDKIKCSEIDLLSNAVKKIVLSEVLEKTMTDQLPLTDALQDSNKVHCGKASILFVDMRGSTKLPEKFSTEQLVKIYRSYIRTVVQAVRYSGGVVRDFMGDGVLAVFVDDNAGVSEDKSVRAARYIATAIDKVLNPVLDQSFKHRISCGIGIHTGEISLSKVGMKGKEQQDDAENEFGIAWIGNSTNLACKFSSAVGNETIFISSSTYSNLSNVESKQNWERVEIAKGSNVLNGYIAKQYYLDLEDDISSCTAAEDSTPLSLAELLSQQYEKQLLEIRKKSEELGRREQELNAKEQELKILSDNVTRKDRGNHLIEQALQKHEYLLYKEVLGSGHCKPAYVLAMGQSFWEGYLSKAINAGEKIGKSEHVVKQEISYAMVDIYETLGVWDKAYDFLVEQATGYAWLHLYTVQTVVQQVGSCDRLKDALYMRLIKGDLSSDKQREFENIKNWLVFDYKK